MQPQDDKHLSSDRLHVLREIDRAAARDEREDIDGILEYLLDQTSSVLRGSVTLATKTQPMVHWGHGEEGLGLEPADVYEVTIGIDGETADLQYWLQPKRAPSGDRDYLRTVALQLGNLLRVHFNRCRERWLDDLEAAFVEVDLHPQLCLDKLTERLPSVFPSTRLIKPNSHQVVQLLLRRNPSDDIIKIVASTGQEAGTLVDINDSVVGLVFETGKRAAEEVVFGNPNEPPLDSVYKGFFSNIKSELCLPLRTDGRTFAALNFESSLESAYGVRDVKYVQWMAPRLMRVVDALRRQIASDEKARLSVTSVQTTYWEAVAKIMSHDLKQPATTIKLSLQRIASELSRLPSSIEASRATLAETRAVEAGIRAGIGRMLDQVDKSETELRTQLSALEDFESQFSDYLQFGPASVYDLAVDAARFARERIGNRRQGPPVDIKMSGDADSRRLVAYTSPLLKVFLYNALENAVYWIRRGISDGAFPHDHKGRVMLTIGVVAATGPVPSLNRYVRLSVCDNGPGAPQHVVDAINDVAPRTVSLRDSGQGYALQAFKDFVQGTGGALRVHSAIGEGFTLEIDLRIPGVEHKNNPRPPEGSFTNYAS